jgi:hypothetical protein
MDTATLTVTDLETAHDGTGTAPSFRDISEVVGGLLNADRDKYFVVADQEAGTYIHSVFSGAVTVANAVD